MKKEKINLFEDILSKALTSMEEEDYLQLIHDYDYLKEYDTILKDLDDGDITHYLECFSIEMLDGIIDYLQKKTTK